MTETTGINTWLADSPDEVEHGERWQVLRDLTDAEYTALKSGIAERGVDNAVALDADGNIVDGHHRIKAWRELVDEGVSVPSVTIKQYETRDEEEIKLLARKLNLQRRQLTNADKHEVIDQQLRETPDNSDNWIAADLGVRHETVTGRREKLSGWTDFGGRENSDRDLNWSLLPEKVRSKPTWREPEGGEDTHQLRKTVDEELARREAEAAENKARDEADRKAHEEAVARGEKPATGADVLKAAKEEQEEKQEQETAEEREERLRKEAEQKKEREAEQRRQREKDKRRNYLDSLMQRYSTLGEYKPATIAKEVETVEQIERHIQMAQNAQSWFAEYEKSLAKAKEERTTLKAV